MREGLRDEGLRVAVMVAGSLAIGAIINAVRTDAVPWRYEPKGQRMAGELARMGVEEGETREVAAGEIELGEFAGMVRERSVLVIDARAPLFFRMGHVPGAVNLPREGFASFLERSGLLRDGKSRAVVVYCQIETCEDSRMVADSLRRVGFASVRVFGGGWRRWIESGEPVEKSS
jgi:3-mercaptopyruvate sulfurtransferase SseA